MTGVYTCGGRPQNIEWWTSQAPPFSFSRYFRPRKTRGFEQYQSGDGNVVTSGVTKSPSENNAVTVGNAGNGK
jgi:hypothetical protein